MSTHRHFEIGNRIIAIVMVLCLSFGANSIPAQDHDRQSSLDRLFALLAQSTSEYQARQIEQRIWSLWFISDNEQVNTAMHRLLDAREKKDYEKAFLLADKIVELEPKNAEGWNQRATAHFLLGNYDHSLQDIVETLKREPRHFGALSGRAYILMKQNRNQQAIETINQALKIHPYLGLRHSIPNRQSSLPL